MREIFKDIEGYEGKYQISNLGRVKSLARIAKSGPNNSATQYLPEKILKVDVIRSGYEQVSFWKDGKKKNHLVHRLVAKAFIPNHQNLTDVNHIDECKTNNSASNLEWTTKKDNLNHGTVKQRISKSNKGFIKHRKLTEEDASKIRGLREEGLKPSAIRKQMQHLTLSIISHFYYGRTNQDRQRGSNQ